MSNLETYTSFEAAKEAFLAEDVPQVVETPDFLDVRVIQPGEYLSPSRKVSKVTKKSNGSVTFELTLDTGIRTLDETGTVYGTGKYPFRAWISTTLFSQQGRPGQTSGAANFLKAAGFDKKAISSLSEIMNAFEESQNIPLKVYVAWTDRGVKQPDGSYTNANLKTKDFITGADENGKPVYSPVITRNGVQYVATEKISSFSAYEGIAA